MANDGTVKIGAEIDEGEFKSGLSKLGSAAKKALGGVTTAVGAVTGVASTAGGAVVKLTSDLAAYGDSIDKMSQKMGMSAEAYQEWDAVMQHSGTSIESMQASMKTLASAAETGNKAFEKLGISQQDLASMSQEDLFGATITALQNVESETERTYLAGQLLGRGATELGALLNTSAEDTQKMKDRVHELGGVMSDEAVKAAAQYQDSLQDMQTAFSGISRSMVSEFLPSVTQVMDGLAEVFSGNGDAGIEMISKGVTDFSTNLSEAIPKIAEMGGEILGALSSAIIENLPTITGTAVDIILMLADGIISALPDIAQAAVDIIISLADGLSEALPELIPAIVEAVTTIVEILTAPDNLSALVDAALSIMLALAQGLIAALPQLIEALPQIIENIVAVLVENAPKLLEAGATLLTMLADGLIEAFPHLLALIPNLIAAIAQGFLDGLSALKEAGGKLFESFAQGFMDKVQAFIDKVKEIVNSVIDIFTGGGGSSGGVSSGGASRPRARMAAPANGTDINGEEGASFTAASFSRTAAIQSLESAIPNAVGRVSVATAAMAPVAGYSAPPPVSGSGGGNGSNQQAPIILRPNWTIQFQGDTAQLGRVLSPIIKDEDHRLGPGV